MEETLGKRIMRYRKQLGMTQDQLAEQLGVSAQAVSKWENDQSCPDIATLPRLAEIFGVSIDELLGHTSRRVHEAEVVPEADESRRIHMDSKDVDDEAQEPSGWHFSYNSGRRSILALAFLVLLVGSLMIAGHLLHWEVSFWGLLWPTALLVFGTAGLLPRFSLFKLGVAFFGGWFLLGNLHIITVDLGGLLFPILLILFGVSLFVDGLRKSKKSSVRFYHTGKNSRQPTLNYDAAGDHFDYSACFSSHSHHIELDTMRSGEIETSFGSYTLDFSGVKHLDSDCHLDCEVSFGELRLRVPRKFAVRCNTDTAFGNLEIKGHPDPDPAGLIDLACDVSFAHMIVEYI